MSRIKNYFRSISSKVSWPIIIGLVLFTLIHLTLVQKTFVVDGEGNMKTAGSGYGDIPLHMTQISKFAFNTLDDLEEPIYYGTKLEYPFGINFISGMLLRATDAWQFSVIAPIMALVILNIFLGFWVYRKFIGKSSLALLALLLFFFGAGWGAYPYIRDAAILDQSYVGFVEEIIARDISTITRWDAVYPAQNISYGAPLSMVFLHQRTFFVGLFGFLLFLALLFSFREKTSFWRIFVAGFVLGILPIMHMHSFIAASFFLFSVFVLALLQRDREIVKHYIFVACIAFVFALPQVMFLIGSKDNLGQGGGFASFRIGWMVGPTIGGMQFPQGEEPSAFSLAYLRFLWVNFGLLLPTFAVSAFHYVRNRKFTITGNLFVSGSLLASVILFCVVQLVKFQPWDYDINKLLVYFHFLALPVIFIYFRDMYARHKKIALSLLVIFSLLFTVSGIVDNIPRLMKRQADLPSMFDSHAQMLALFVRSHVPEETLVLTGTNHLNPVASIAGRTVFVGYPGWLWTRGINYGERERSVSEFYKDPAQNLVFLEQYPFSHILVDDFVRNDYKADKEYFETNFEKVFESGQYGLYKI